MLKKTLAAFERRSLFKFPIPGKGFFSSIRSYTNFFQQLRRFESLTKTDGGVPIDLFGLYPMLSDKTENQSIDPHYFYQALWLFEKIKDNNISEHVDLGSQINMLGFLSTITNLKYVDLRDPELKLSNFEFIRGDITKLPFESNTIRSISSLHVIEHIGLGRYGDTLDPQGYLKGLNEIARVCSPQGNVFLSIPCGKERVMFNAHRILDPGSVINIFSEFELVSFSGVDNKGNYIIDANMDDFKDYFWSCGFFHFKKHRDI
jgi:hypothetical protein